ncbi:MAG: LPXTG cell wall anchor domain-containing protein [Bifidobacteriaceae bacterium]|nr:LPXTG cell wall anchor domain-containing protein [Bifidobacteriaceae bacterium]
MTKPNAGENVENTPTSSTLPSTGGIGTTILYTVGGLIVLVAGVGLAIALRRRQA